MISNKFNIDYDIMIKHFYAKHYILGKSYKSKILGIFQVGNTFYYKIENVLGLTCEALVSEVFPSKEYKLKLIKEKFKK